MNRRSLFKFNLITIKIYNIYMNVFQVCEVGVGGQRVCVGTCTCLYACMHIRVNTCACFYSYYVSWWCCHAKWAYLSSYLIHYYSHFNSAHIYVKRHSHCSLNIIYAWLFKTSPCNSISSGDMVGWLWLPGHNMPSQSQLLPGDIQTAQTTSHITKDQTKSQKPFSNLDSKVTEVTIFNSIKHLQISRLKGNRSHYLGSIKHLSAISTQRWQKSLSWAV